MTRGKLQIESSSSEIWRSAADDILDDFLAYKTHDGEGEMPLVIFVEDLLLFGESEESRSGFDDREAVHRALRGRGLHFRFAERGYVAVSPPPGRGRWKCKKFQARRAFVRRDVAEDSHVAAVMNALAAHENAD